MTIDRNCLHRRFAARDAQPTTTANKKLIATYPGLKFAAERVGDDLCVYLIGDAHELGFMSDARSTRPGELPSARDALANVRRSTDALAERNRKNRAFWAREAAR